MKKNLNYKKESTKQKPELRCLIRIQGDTIELVKPEYYQIGFIEYLNSLGINIELKKEMENYETQKLKEQLKNGLIVNGHFLCG